MRVSLEQRKRDLLLVPYNLDGKKSVASNSRYTLHIIARQLTQRNKI